MDRARAWMMGVLALAFVGTGAELLLIGHTEEWTQIIPVVGIALGLIALAVVWLRPSGAVVQLFRVLSGLLIVTGVVGVVLHYRGNAEFELEMRPTMAGLELIWNSLTGATPALAPGSLIPLGLIGLISTYGHPAAGDGKPGEEETR